jgi:hypothetical protein
MSKHEYLKKYGGNLSEYFTIKSKTFNSLLLKNFNIKKIYKFDGKNLIKSTKLDNPGIFLIYLD